jgi:hypothetical protein
VEGSFVQRIVSGDESIDLKIGGRGAIGLPEAHSNQFIVFGQYNFIVLIG